jgi:hypothetical protein
MLKLRNLKKATITKSAIDPCPYLLNRGDKVTVKVIFKGSPLPDGIITWMLERDEMIPVKIVRIVSIVEGVGDLYFFDSYSPQEKAQNLKRAVISSLPISPAAYLFNRGEKVTVTFIPPKEQGRQEEKIIWTLDKNEVTPVKITKFISINEGEGELYFLW